ncbi:MAG: L-aspartate oxidase [Candidatus Sumerlaeota bacterium]|nr:L-aspartate oxidase [Candidatus Sumerlaeota bacterium]
MSDGVPEQTDVLIIGSGLAGCAAAVAAARGGAKATMVTREENAAMTNTRYAQGGIIFRGKDDSPELLVRDILDAGAGISYRPACELLATEGPRLVQQILIDEFQVPFDRDESGELDLTEEGAHSRPRIIHVEDLTGRAIEERALAAVNAEPGVTLLRGGTAVDLLTLSHHSRSPLDIYEPPRCVGAYILIQKTSQVIPVLARETILATGGLGQLFLHTTNPRGARGDGIAMAYRAGARLLNLEYIQFHPTTLYHPDSGGFLISESVRGEGGILVRRNGERFMDDIHPLGSLAPRDVVDRAIHDTLLRYDEPCVYLDLTHKPADWIRQRFPNIHAKCLSFGIDIARQPIPVVPAAHYACGGVAVDLEGQSSVRGLRAAGEVSCTGIHGANRLASTSLLEALVWGWRAGQASAREAARAQRPFPEIEPWVPMYEDSDPALILQDWLSIRHTMWNYVGLARSRRRMRRARQLLRELQMEIEDFYARARLTDDIVGLRNGVQTALAVLYAAWENHRSRGCHYLVNDV